MQEVKTFKTSSAETLHRECKISSTKHFLVHFSLNYHDILVKSLGAYYTPELRFFFSNFQAQSGNCVLYSAIKLRNRKLYVRFKKKKQPTYRPTFENVGRSTSNKKNFDDGLRRCVIVIHHGNTFDFH